MLIKSTVVLLPASNFSARKLNNLSGRYHLFIKAFYKYGFIQLPQAVMLLVWLFSAKEK